MKAIKEVSLNIGFLEGTIRVLLLIPTGGLAVLAVVCLHTYIFLSVPPYLLATALTKYGPVKHILRILKHKPVNTNDNGHISLTNLA